MVYNSCSLCGNSHDHFSHLSSLISKHNTETQEKKKSLNSQQILPLFADSSEYLINPVHQFNNSCIVVILKCVSPFFPCTSVIFIVALIYC